MGAHSTLRITRSKAKAVVMQRMIDSLDNDDYLKSQLDDLLYDRLYNVVICDDDDDLADDERI